MKRDLIEHCFRVTTVGGSLLPNEAVANLVADGHTAQTRSGGVGSGVVEVFRCVGNGWMVPGR
jgi:hypothetical protein